ncbi:hypothetical protein Smar_0756 [Staphylothermus marinus F1]|uniref:YhfC family intramembrane metalloprotease n=1 Tax=Staphylothermus marinus (strain ATCC 43588 / DSM 3639 / JCM 9404 / F1) TaxID=399550 RepID=A3DMJ7_STAMF|nr:hypothetical protein [Staphylothermus marinus]ABN69857.1 hypothetical protein Smar_0756 [Staphylothermus marinus F1]
MVLLYPLTIIIVSIIILLILYRVTKSFSIEAFLIGIGLLILTLIIQPPIQQLPILLLRINPEASIYTLILVLFYAALVSGFLQELLKLIGVRGKNIVYALWLGAGFGFGEASLVVLNQFMNMLAGVNIPLFLGLVSCYERFIVLLYHVFSATLLLQYYIRGRVLFIYIVIALTHSLMNYQAVLLIKLYGLSLPVLLIVYSVISVVVLFLYTIYRQGMKRLG